MPNYDPSHNRNHDEIKWEEIARDQLAVRFNEEYNRLGTNVQTIGRKIREGDPIQKDELHQFRSGLETMEGAVSRHLIDIGEISSDEPSEQIQRSGRGVLQALQEISRTLDSDSELKEYQLKHAKSMLAEAETELENLREKQGLPE